MYKIRITKEVDNPLYDVDKSMAYKKCQETAYSYDKIRFDEKFMSPTMEVPTLVVDLTDEEFKAIKKAVLEVM